MLGSEGTRCTPEEWAEHGANPRRGLPRIVIHGARGHACGPGRSTPAGAREGGAIEPGIEEEVAVAAGSAAGQRWDED